MAERFGLTPIQTARLGRFGTTLVGDVRAPTTVREPRLVRDDHLADALVALELAVVRAATRIADLGAGAGVPGIPLAIALPDAEVTLIEGNQRKCEFMRSAVADLGLSNAAVVHARAETWQAGLGRSDVVTARALAPLDVVAEYAAPLLRLGGALVAWRGQREPAAEEAARRAAEILGLSAAAPQRVAPYVGARDRHLHVMLKTRPTPDRFPRRDGVARKRPLGRESGGNPRT
ncbi:MAG: 16S rRNA (guanine(527)-N(7))-methyltransferase RsmG [Acidobacteriota bacterium]|nr:16S rRNA (guanine(527)-N(7))-methyltransferase RsmG [Acidobacteriota bacterium]